MSFAQTFKALSDPIRRDILTLLKDGQMSAGDIANQFDLAQASISYHLMILKKADLIQETKVKNFIYYEINTSVLEDVMVWISDLKGDKNNENQ
ncbi:autorepressor SdpR family transcription factor [Streptococcus uberis]|uniref:autorepressor SdpR family transcription factor n=1 Tax=Streptococcus uberis TaxID=1349 RepID=UPI001FF5B06C|nr:autorepressor SdpR family transcription factor [Streptococcus uberis]MCK1168931.1 autorepressor SdpR family transcription factor [Streptococcus uberis]MCK1186594.1 autorepressor SdpR family transcription factor [Streptococcus uberis]MCK1212505.1 autorepressor SdpR family transcription factor [Streptococcus uberis]MCK1241108.1 autorepressor SdpR family transcription factor [Streptococcus uberis]MCK1242200.1 autorepressor SdpR family transcription factor [Streptococcus uberis]